MNEYWSDFDDAKVVLFPESALTGILLSQDERSFLSSIGLPDSAAPFLSFECPVGQLVSVSDQWRQGNEFRKYKVIGANGSGDPIALDASCGNVVYLNHDDNFTKVFINTLPSKLAASLKAFGVVVADSLKENGEDAYLDNNIPIHVQERFKKEMKAIDFAALQPGSFWHEQVESMAGGPWS